VLLRGALETLAVLAAFQVFGLAVAAWSRPPSYPAPPVSATDEEPRLWLVDGFNVLHAGVLSGRDRRDWWTRPRREALLGRIAGFDAPGAEIWVVFDGPRSEADADPGTPAPGVRPVFAPSADAWLLQRVREAAAGSLAVAVVTADRSLADRARHRGARIVSPRAFLARCAGSA
jgi:hypothetical protein